MDIIDQSRSPSVPTTYLGPGVPLLHDQDLHDESRFIKLGHVPLIDVHDDPIKGNIDLGLLTLIAKNSNDRVKQGDPIVVTVGHMERKQTVILIRPDGSKVILPGTKEIDQPPIVGYAKNLVIDRFRNNDWLFGDMYIRADHANDPLENPFRSVERVVPPDDGNDDGDDSTRHYIDRISLLRTPPEREGGALHYGQASDILGCCGTARPLLRLGYARDQEPLRKPEMPLPNGAPPEIEEEGPGGTGEPTSDEPTPPGGEGLPATVGEMTPSDFFEGFAHVLRMVLDEQTGGDAPGGGESADAPGETVPYESGRRRTVDDEVHQSHRVPAGGGRKAVKQYDATQAGGGNTFVPGAGGGRKNYARREAEVFPRIIGAAKPAAPAAVTRTQYAKDKAENDEIVTYLYAELSAMQLNGRRIVYSQKLHGLRDQEGVDLSDEDIESFVAALGDVTPATHEDEKISEIRKHYSRRPINTPSVGVAMPPYASAGHSASDRPPTPAEVRHATALRMDSKGTLSFAEALAKARGL